MDRPIHLINTKPMSLVRHYIRMFMESWQYCNTSGWNTYVLSIVDPWNQLSISNTCTINIADCYCRLFVWVTKYKKLYDCGYGKTNSWKKENTKHSTRPNGPNTPELPFTLPHKMTGPIGFGDFFLWMSCQLNKIS